MGKTSVDVHEILSIFLKCFPLEHGRIVRSEFGKSSIRGDDVVEQVADGVYLKVDGQWVPPSAVRIQLGALCDAFHHIVLMD